MIYTYLSCQYTQRKSDYQIRLLSADYLRIFCFSCSFFLISLQSIGLLVEPFLCKYLRRIMVEHQIKCDFDCNVCPNITTVFNVKQSFLSFRQWIINCYIYIYTSFSRLVPFVMYFQLVDVFIKIIGNTNERLDNTYPLCN